MRRALAGTAVALVLIVVAAQSGSAGPIRAACRNDTGRAPTASDGHPPRSLLRRLAVLRHGRRAHVAFEEFFTLHHIAVRYVRRLGEHYYLVPATVRPAGYTTPVLCRRRTPPGVSRRVERRRERRALHSFGLYLVSYSRDGGHNTPSGLGGRKGRLLGNAITNLVEDASHLWLAGVVPDGVASVRLTFKGRSHTRGVTRNFWVVRLGGSPPPDELEHSTTEWLAADGSVRRAFHGIANPWP